MKKNVLLVAIMLLFLSQSFSQITVTSLNIIDAGNYVILAKDTISDSTITPGNAGVNQIWDFSDLKIGNVDTLAFVAPAATPYDTVFTTDNVASFFADMNAYVYFRKSSEKLESIGAVGDILGTGTPLVLEYDPTEKLMVFPFTYLDSFQDTSSVEIIVDTIKIVQIAYKTVESDAWGNITTPMGSFDVIRLKISKIESQNFFLDYSGFWVPVYSTADTTIRYEWWTDNINARYPIVAFDWDTTNNVIDGEVEWLIGSNSDVADITTDKNIKIFPNPGSENVNVITDNICLIEVLNLHGEIVLVSDEKTDKASLNIQHLSKGIYFVRVHTDEDMIVRKYVVN